MTDDELRELVAADSQAIGRLEGLQEENARLWEQHREKNDRVRGEIRESRVHTDRMITS
ncbi:MAG: hypothetical protein GY842_28600, partial [bacterium]|nr:hypothetical protein [bacterium]